VLSGAKTCFKPRAPFGIVGFSNGGDFVSGAFGLCLKPKAKWYIAIGSGGLKFLNKKDIRSCAPFRMQIGRGDVTYRRTSAFFSRIKPYATNLELQTFKGGHIISEEVLVPEILKLQSALGTP
jgi:hypothetical protein